MAASSESARVESENMGSVQKKTHLRMQVGRIGNKQPLLRNREVLQRNRQRTVGGQRKGSARRSRIGTRVADD